MSFTSSVANGLRAPPPSSIGTRLREALASAAAPATCRKVGDGRRGGRGRSTHSQDLFQPQSRNILLLESYRNALNPALPGWIPSDICVGRERRGGVPALGCLLWTSADLMK